MGVGEILLGQDIAEEPSFSAEAPKPPLKNKTLENGLPSSFMPLKLEIHTGEPEAAITFSPRIGASAPNTKQGT